MKPNQLDCCIVRDLLPAYIEELTEPETARQVAAHLDECAGCRQLERDLRTHIPAEPVPQKSLRFLKKIRRTRLLAAALALLVTALFVWWLYDLQFHYANTDAGRLAAAQDFVWEDLLLSDSETAESRRIPRGTPVDVVAYQQRNNLLFLSFTAGEPQSIRGSICLIRGLNDKYRLLGVSYADGGAAPGLMTSSRYFTADGMLYAFSGSLGSDAGALRLSYSCQTPDGTRISGQGHIPLSGPYFLHVWSEKELASLLDIAQYQPNSLQIDESVLLDSGGAVLSAAADDDYAVSLEDAIDLTYLLMLAAGLFGLFLTVGLLKNP